MNPKLDKEICRNCPERKRFMKNYRIRDSFEEDWDRGKIDCPVPGLNGRFDRCWIGNEFLHRCPFHLEHVLCGE